MTRENVPDDKPLFVGDISHAVPTHGALEQDIVDVTESLRQGGITEQAIHQQMVHAHALARRSGLGVLSELEDLGIDEASIIKDKLEEIDPNEEPLHADMVGVVRIYETELELTVDPVERRRLQELTDISKAVAAISLVRLVRGDSTATRSSRDNAITLID